MGESIRLTDSNGCVARPDLITRFYKMKEISNPQSDLTLYAYFKVSGGIQSDSFFNFNSRLTALTFAFNCAHSDHGSVQEENSIDLIANDF